MIAYDNSRQYRILFRCAGSIIPHCLPICLCTGLLGLALALMRELGQTEDWPMKGDYMRHSFSIQILAMIVGWLLVMRVNMALGRWMEAIHNIQEMLSMWGSAFKTLNAFFSGKVDTPVRLHHVLMFRVRLAHWFSLMSCLAFATLHSKELACLDDVSIRSILEPPSRGRGQSLAQQSSASVCSSCRSLESSTCHTARQALEAAAAAHTAGSRTQDLRRGHRNTSKVLELCVLHAPNSLETEQLDAADDKVNLVSLWISQGVIEAVRDKSLDTPAPIVTRVFQDLSQGMLGYNQAQKVAMTPFPFPFAQLVSVILIFLDVLLPFHTDAFAKNKFVTPLMSFFLPLCYHGLNQIAIELEEPFGDSVHTVDIKVRQVAFLGMLIDVLRLPEIPPEQTRRKSPTSQQKPESVEETIYKGLVSTRRSSSSNWRGSTELVLEERHPWDLLDLGLRPPSVVEPSSPSWNERSDANLADLMHRSEKAGPLLAELTSSDIGGITIAEAGSSGEDHWSWTEESNYEEASIPVDLPLAGGFSDTRSDEDLVKGVCSVVANCGHASMCCSHGDHRPRHRRRGFEERSNMVDDVSPTDAARPVRSRFVDAPFALLPPASERSKLVL